LLLKMLQRLFVQFELLLLGWGVGIGRRSLGFRC